MSTPAKVRDPFGNLTQYLFDKNGRVKGIKDPMANLTSLAYDSGGVTSHIILTPNSYNLLTLS